MDVAAHHGGDGGEMGAGLLRDLSEGRRRGGAQRGAQRGKQLRDGIPEIGVRACHRGAVYARRGACRVRGGEISCRALIGRGILFSGLGGFGA